MSAIVPVIPPLLESPPAEVYIGKSARALLFRDATRLVNWALGRGQTVIPANCYGNSTTVWEITAGNTLRLNYYQWAREHTALRLLWVVTLQPKSAASIPFTFASSLGASQTAVAASTGYYYPTTLAFVDDATGLTSGSEIYCSLTNDAASGTLEVLSVACYALPHAELEADTTDDGASDEGMAPGQAVYSPNAVSSGLRSLANAVASLPTDQGRAGLWAFSVGDGSYRSIADGSAVTLFEVPPVLLGRKLYTTNTTRTIDYAFKARVATAGATHRVTITMASGAVATTDVTTTTMSWHTGTVAVDAEDVTSSDGRRSTRWDEATIAVQRTAGTGNFWWEAFCFGDG